MSSRIFQSIVLQMKGCTDRAIGVIDSSGSVIACNELSIIGEHIPGVPDAISGAVGVPAGYRGRSYKRLSGWEVPFDYAVFVTGEDAEARLICSLASVTLKEAKTHYDEKHDRAGFVRHIISDNIMRGDIPVRARDLHLAAESPRGVLLIRQTGSDEMTVVEILQSLFPDRNSDFVISMNETDVVLIKQLSEGSEGNELDGLAGRIEKAVTEIPGLKVVIGIGRVADRLQDLASSYKEAQVAIDVGRVFETEKAIVKYENLGIGRLIYQLPTTLCEMFLKEVFRTCPIDSLDQDTLLTIESFFENNLNVSETARKLYVHRNTLVYRLEKIRKLTGLDLRKFDDATTFKVAWMVRKYLNSCGIQENPHFPEVQ